MAIGDLLKKLIIQDDIQPSPQQKAPPSQPSQPQPASPPKPSVEDPKIVEALASALKEKALTEFDYIKFMEGENALVSVIPDEATRFKAAFATVRGTGITKARLLETAKHYLAILDVEKQGFIAGVDGQVKDKIGSNRKTMADVELEIEGHKKQIERSKEALTKKQEELDSLTRQVSEWEAKIESAKTGFDLVSGRMRSEIEGDIQKITAYLE